MVRTRRPLTADLVLATSAHDRSFPRRTVVTGAGGLWPAADPNTMHAAAGHLARARNAGGTVPVPENWRAHTERLVSAGADHDG